MKTIESFRGQAVERSGLLLFEPEVACAVVDALEEKGVRILGLDAFAITQTTIQPFMEHSVDLSYRTDGSWSVARKHLDEKKNSGFLFEIVADE